MELRSTLQRQTRQEFKELKITLTGLGYYEDGMNVQEMQQILDALHQSEDNFMNADMERALRESELDFIHMSEGMANSTMISAFTPQRSQQQCSSIAAMQNTDNILSDSPEIPTQHITVNVDIHHPLDWSPPATEGRRRSPIRQLSPLNGDNNMLAYTMNRKMDFSLANNRADVQRNDSGLSLSDGSAASSILTIGSYCTSSSSAHSEFTHSSSQDEGNRNVTELSWDDRHIASSSSVAISSDDNQISNAEDDSSHPST